MFVCLRECLFATTKHLLPNRGFRRPPSPAACSSPVLAETGPTGLHTCSVQPPLPMLKLHNKFQILLHCNMSTMKQILNPITGRSEWEPQPEHYDYTQEIARAAFADMLHDTERNQKYEAGLRRAVQRVHAQGRRANVLDIGTGTGILSMMAVRCGADTVTACEAFRPMADCAERIMEANGVRAAITLIKKRSTDIVVGPGGDMERRANILVTEVFDTELIGEGAIGIFNHAHEHLLEANCVVVPDRGTMYAQVVESPLCWSWNMPKVVANLDGEVLLNTPAEILRCKGSAALHDVQLNQLPAHQFRTLIAPTAVLEFDFSGRRRIPAESAVSLRSVAEASGHAHAVFMWWDIDMDQEHEIRLSCAPSWAHPDYERLSAAAQPAVEPPQNVIPWRDHWMQAVYFVPSALHVQRGETVHLNFCHDEYSLWFDVSRARNSFADGGGRQPLCDCGFHNAYSRTRIGQLNDGARNKKYLALLERTIDANSVVLSLSDGSLLGLACAKLGAKSVICLEPHRYSNQVLQKYVATNGLKNVRLADSVEDLGDLAAVTHVVAEPSFVSSIVPFDNFYFGTLLTQLRSRLAADVQVLPRRAFTYAVPVEFLDLQKIRSPLGVKEGFDLGIFDRLVEGASLTTDASVEAQPLWEYPCRALAQPQVLLDVDFDAFLENKEQQATFNFEVAGECNGVAIWTDWLLDGSTERAQTTVSTGPTVPASQVRPGQLIDWDVHSRQGVHLLPRAQHVQPNQRMQCETSFVPANGDLDFRFDIK